MARCTNNGRNNEEAKEKKGKEMGEFECRVHGSIGVESKRVGSAGVPRLKTQSEGRATACTPLCVSRRLKRTQKRRGTDSVSVKGFVNEV